MDVEIISKKQNKLLDRTEIEAQIRYDGAMPNRKEIKEKVCTKLGFNPENSAIRKIDTGFALKRINALIHAYASKEKMMKTEPLYILVREGLAEKKKKEKRAKKAAPATRK